MLKSNVKSNKYLHFLKIIIGIIAIAIAVISYNDGYRIIYVMFYIIIAIVMLTDVIIMRTRRKKVKFRTMVNQ